MDEHGLDTVGAVVIVFVIFLLVLILFRTGTI